MKKEAILVSACLLGVCCRYDGASKPNADVIKLRERYVLIPICPEVDGGLPTPRTPSEQVGDRVLMSDGKDVTDNFRAGAEAALERAKTFSCNIALLKARSPSCGSGMIYDGSFSGRLTEGNGVTADLLKKNGITIYTEEELDKLI
ncbi:MAG: DUF523 domain-containing protein [Clostridia bacterium]|nr:DUF523 domain-containing protein [Clostridia bacterium]